MNLSKYVLFFIKINLFRRSEFFWSDLRLSVPRRRELAPVGEHCLEARQLSRPEQKQSKKYINTNKNNDILG